MIDGLAMNCSSHGGSLFVEGRCFPCLLSEISRLTAERDEARKNAEMANATSKNQLRKSYMEMRRQRDHVVIQRDALRSTNKALIAVAEAAQNFLDHSVGNTPRYFAMMNALATLRARPEEP